MVIVFCMIAGILIAPDMNESSLNDDSTVILKEDFGENQKQSFAEKAVNDARKDAKKWMAYPPLAFLIGAGSLVTATGIFGVSLETIVLGGLGGGYLSLASYYYLNRLDKNDINDINTTAIESYEKAYSRELKKRKLKNITTSTTVVGLAAALGALTLLHSYGGSGGYDICFDPRCD